MKLNDCVLPFQRVKGNDDTSFIGGAILPYVSKRNMIDNLLLVGFPFLVISFVSLLLYIGSYTAALLHVYNILSMPVDTIDFLLQWMPATSLGFALLFLIPAAPSIIFPLINSRTMRSIQTDLTTTIRGICENLEIAEFKRHHIWQDTHIPKHVSQNIAEAVKMMPSCEHKELIERLGRP
ncbi:hypothetical protein EU537_05890 [Candidatus Thorarchaeota archaeon]|nr:MAG: hypothetical protein EU537_05890 [Candidatus Thorarchaeota archaeon]